jgi:hypothetical protein
MNEQSDESLAGKSSALTEAIAHVFSDNHYPGDDRLTVYDVAGREFDETFQLLRGKTWQECPVAEFIRGDTPIPDLTPEAFHYFMPALLIASLEASDIGGDVCGTLTFYLSPGSARCTEGEFQYDHTEDYLRRMRLFSKEQREVIIQVINEYVARGWEEIESAQPTIEFLCNNEINVR